MSKTQRLNSQFKSSILFLQTKMFGLLMIPLSCWPHKLSACGRSVSDNYFALLWPAAGEAVRFSNLPDCQADWIQFSFETDYPLCWKQWISRIDIVEQLCQSKILSTHLPPYYSLKFAHRKLPFINDYSIG